MGTSEITRRSRCIAAVRIAFALAALTPGVAAVPQPASAHFTPAPASLVPVDAGHETPRVVEEWERMRRHQAHH